MKKIIVLLGLFISMVSLTACSKTPKDIEALFEMLELESYNFTVDFVEGTEEDATHITGKYIIDGDNVWYEAKGKKNSSAMIPDAYYSVYSEGTITNYTYKDEVMTETTKYPNFDAYQDIKNIFAGLTIESFEMVEKKVYKTSNDSMTITFDSKGFVVVTETTTYTFSEVEKTKIKLPKLPVVDAE